ncbi:AAA family ATPase [Nonomuraea typhae]|uniref:AAA family ATPase n=1 Tax=Nonomuraea typhae TaxID=2603600 RepID=UPI0012FAEC64|nr:AAA family ATPase [Nonomuraea typhae]
MTRRNDVPEWAELPPPVLAALDAWLEHEGIEHLALRGWFPAGRGHDPVGLVERSSDGGTVNLVAKFYQPPLELKVDRVAAAGRTASTFPHLAEPYGEPVTLGTWRLILQDVALGDLGAVRPLLVPVLGGDPGAAAYCEEIVASIVEDWNSGDGVPTPRWRTATVEDFMWAILGKRMAPDGPIRSWADLAGVPSRGHPETMTRRGWGRTLPNPFMLLNNPAHSRLSLESIATGRAHGDLSGRNIMLRMHPEPLPGAYKLIDLDRFDTDAPLARDPMHLLVALAMDLLAEDSLHEAARHDLVGAIVDPQAGTSTGIVRRFGEISAAIHEGPMRWARRSGHGQDWRVQSMLALAAAALMHLGRPFFPDRDKEWCLHLAAAATERHQVLTTSDDPYAPRRQAARVPTSPGEGGRMDTIRLAVLRAPGGDAFADTLTERLAGLPVEIGQDVAQADAVAVVLTGDLQVTDPAGSRDLPVVWLRVHPVDVPPGCRCYDFTGPEQWEELIGHLRWIGSPACLIDRYEQRLRTLDERFPDAERRARDRIEQERQLLKSRINSQKVRQADRGRPATHAPPVTGRGPAAGSHAGGLRYYGQPLPLDEPLDRLEETQALIDLLASGHGAIALIGPDGNGKTAMISRLFHRLPEVRDVLPIDGFVYLPARGPYPINTVTVLSAIAAVTPDRDRARRVHATVRSSAVPLGQNVSDVARAIGETRVLLVLDDVQDLVDDEGAFADRQLANTLTMALQQAVRHLQLVMVLTGREVAEPRPVTRLSLEHGLEHGADWAFLAAMVPDDLLGLDAHRGVAADLTTLTAGHPRVLELMITLLHGEPDLTLTGLVLQLKREGLTGPALVPPLLRRVLAALDRTEQRVLQALAVLGRPEEPAAVDAMLAPYLPGQLNAPTLDELVRRRLIRKDGHRYALPREPDAACLLDGLDLGFAADRTREPRPLTRRALYALAADYFAASAPQVLGEEDMIRRLAEVEMRLAGGERDKAGEVMAWLDTIWSHEQRANPWLVQLRARVPMEDDYLDVQNLSSRAMTLLNQDDPDTAIDDLEEAIEICLRPDLLLHLSACDLAIQLGGAHLQRGDCATAEEWYAYALDEAEEGDLHLLAGQARGGLMRCLYEHGKFKEALREYKRAKAHLDRGDEPGAMGSSLVLDLAHAAVLAATGRLRPAEEVLDQGRREAEELGQRHLTGAFIGQRATLCLDMGRPDRARELATHVLDLGMQMNNVPLRREAAIVLAQAYLGMDGSADSLRAAQAAANHAVLLSRSNRTGVAFLVQGIVQLRLGENPSAQAAFRLGHDQAEELLRRDPGSFEAEDLLGLTSCGLGICGGKRERFREAEEAFTRARTIAPTQVVALRAGRLFDHLVPDPDAWTRPVYAAATACSGGWL